MIIGHFIFRRRWLSNFYHCYVAYKGEAYKSVEHAYQAQKATNRFDGDWIASASGAAEAQRRGRSIKPRPGFDSFKERLMLKLLWSKFYNDHELRQKLIATWPHELIHGNTHHDEFWGVNRRTGKGDNRLGKLLMLLRDKIRDGTDHTIPKMGVKKLQRHAAYRQRRKDRLEDVNLGTVVRPLPKLSHAENLRYKPVLVRNPRQGNKKQSKRAARSALLQKIERHRQALLRDADYGMVRKLDPKRKR